MKRRDFLSALLKSSVVIPTSQFVKFESQHEPEKEAPTEDEMKARNPGLPTTMELYNRAGWMATYHSPSMYDVCPYCNKITYMNREGNCIYCGRHIEDV